MNTIITGIIFYIVLAGLAIAFVRGASIVSRRKDDDEFDN